MKNFEEIGREIGNLVERKNAAYGSSFAKAGDFLRLLFPNGVAPDRYTDMLLLVRIFDKQMRIATDRDALGESPFTDIGGYSILGAHLHQSVDNLEELALHQNRDARGRILKQPVEVRFWRHVKKSSRCWEWTGKKFKAGHGYMILISPGRLKNRSLLAHRISWEIHHGPIPSGMVVYHTCTNVSCVNPAHLKCGTQAENMAHLRASRRSRLPPRLCGSNNPSAKLTATQVAEIRRRHIPWKVSYKQLGMEFGVSSSTVEAIVTNRAWKQQGKEAR